MEETHGGGPGRDYWNNGTSDGESVEHDSPHEVCLEHKTEDGSVSSHTTPTHDTPDEVCSKQTAPDGGWGWLIVFASFLLQALTIGFTYTFGTVYMDLLVYFQDTKTNAAWIGSIQPALLYFVSVVAGPCIRRYGWRAVTITGTAISTVGYCTSALANHPYVLFITYGGMTGIGFGLLYMTAMVTVQHYFDKKRSLATGIAVSGSGAGTMCLGLLARKLLDRYQWRITLLLEGGIVLFVGLICAVLFKPLRKQNLEDETKHILTHSTHNTYGALADPGVMDIPNYSSGATEETCPGVLINENGDPVCTNTRSRDDGRTQKLIRKFQNTFRFHLIKNPTMILVCLTVICFCFGYHVPYTFTPQRAFDMFNIQPDKGVMLISTMGLSNLISRLFFGWLGGYGVRLRHWMLGTAIIMCGVLNSLIFVFTTYPLLLLFSILFGVFSGCFASLFAVVLVDLMGLDVIEYTLGIALASGSVIFLTASPIAGCIIEHTNSYDIAFLTVGVIQIVGGLLFYSIIPVRRYQSGPGLSLADRPASN